jgi:hypothetical protein
MKGGGTSGLAERREEQVAQDEFFKRIAETQEPPGAALREGPVGTAARRAVRGVNGGASERPETPGNGNTDGRGRRTLERSGRTERRTAIRLLTPLVAIVAVAGCIVTAISAMGGSASETRSAARLDRVQQPSPQEPAGAKHRGVGSSQRRAERQGHRRRSPEDQRAAGSGGNDGALSSAAAPETRPAGSAPVDSSGRDGFGFEDGAH